MRKLRMFGNSSFWDGIILKDPPRKTDWSQLVWVNYNDLTTTSLEIMVNKGNHPQMALIQVSDIL